MWCADQQSNMLIAKSMKKMLRLTFSVFEPEQCSLEMRNYKHDVFIQISSYFRRWNLCVVFLFFVLCWYILLILSFGCVTIVNREMKKCQCYYIYDKTNGDVARLEWVGDSLRR